MPYIVEAGSATDALLEVTVKATAAAALDQLTAVWLRVAYVAYGPHGRTHHAQHVVLPLQFPEPPSAAPADDDGSSGVVPVRTHMLCHLDDPAEVARRYAGPVARPDDVVAIGETPLAVMQGRVRHPEGIRPGLVARLACLVFHPTSSLATACGMQALVDVAGAWRVAFAALAAAAARVLLRMRGVFYRLAGRQAPLIDDVSGTLPPYDQFVCLGPTRVEDEVERMAEAVGCGVAIVDVNDLKRVKILAASEGVDTSKLTEALRPNPAGNGEEQTPVVVVRGCNAPEAH